MKIKLYYGSGAASLCVHWMLIEMGIDFEAVKIDLSNNEQKGEAYLKINPQGKVPALELDGNVYTESVALVMLLSEHSERLKPAVGTDEHARWTELLIYFANSLLPAFREWFYAPVESGGNKEKETFLKDLVRPRIEAVYDRIEALLADGRTHLLGNQLRSVDFVGTMLMRWSRNMPKPATQWPNINKYVHRMRSMPSFIEVYKREEIKVKLLIKLKMITHLFHFKMEIKKYDK
ncbi:hypothetical protein PPL_00014 [Heterostelium album PN500]|uniref:Glutathione S-transferase n=1 Tax=Heterostelium pallidum (strain ATCC 26659 / Pp 5 / PN500) TaxID=670386 RepID=D3BVL3_HETP5|nr:hypothetical protein PPL_00014 [Heterostelium album PN500]EFA74516.1 hypothetical protein PPL_00014 [Heterostelium album PN500]|eukprot:XP_020426650.1 hypothetical protein PPL_00014 [Heterostelium album PN500]